MLSSSRYISLVVFCTLYYCFNALAYGQQQQYGGGYGGGYVEEQQKPKAEASVKENPYQVNNAYAGAIPLPGGYGSVNLPTVNFALQSSGQVVKNMNYGSIKAPPSSNAGSYANIPAVQPSAVSFAPSSTVQPPPPMGNYGSINNAMLSGGTGYASITEQPVVNYGLSSVMPPVAMNYGSINAASSGSGSQMKIDQKPQQPPSYVQPSSTVAPPPPPSIIISTQPPAPAVEGYAAPPGSSAAGAAAAASSSGAGASAGASGQGMAASGGSQTDSIGGYAAAPGTPATSAGQQSGGQGQAAATGDSQMTSFGYGASMPGIQQQKQPAGPSEAAYGSTDQQTVVSQQPPKLPDGGFGGYLALGSISQGSQSKTNYANVGGYVAPVVSTAPTTVVAPTAEAAPCTATPSPDSSAVMPVGGYAAAASGADAQEIATAVPSSTEKSSCTADVAAYDNSKKLDQPLPTETMPTPNTTEKPSPPPPSTTPTTTTTSTMAMTEATMKVTKPCVDTHRFCSFWKDQGECEKNPDYMKVNCAISCKTC